MRWHVSARGQQSGPWEEADVMRMVGDGLIDHVQGEAGGAWLPIPQSPFAGYQRAPMPAAPAVAAAAKPGSSLTGAQWIFICGALGLWAFSMAAGWGGVLVGLGIVGFSIWRYREGKPSLMDIAWKRPRGLGRTIVTVSLGLLATLCGSTSVVAQRDAAAKVAAAAKASAVAKVEQAAQRKALEEQVPQKVSAWRRRLADVPSVAAQQGPEAARLAAATIGNEIDTQAKILGEPPVPLLATVAAEAQKVVAFHAAWAALGEQTRAVDDYLIEGKKAVQKAQWLAADGAFSGAQATLTKLETADAEVKKHLPADLNLAAKRTEVEHLRSSIAGQVKAEQKRLDREEAARKAKADKEAAYATLCGEKPLVSSWDGEVAGLAGALKESAHDPDSIEVSKCTQPLLTSDNCWLVTCNVRGKNAFGALILQRKTYNYSQAIGFMEAH